MNDTVKLLRECEAGIKMGEAAMKKLIPKAKSKELRAALEVALDTHVAIMEEVQNELIENNDDLANSHPFALLMSKLKLNMKLMINESDNTIADFMTDGCDMGIKSLSKFLNEYKSASTSSRDMAKRLIASEEYLENKLRDFL